MAERIGDFLVRIGAMTEGQVGQIIAAQKGGDGRMFGEIAIAMGFVDENALKAFVERKADDVASV